jgi:carboxymethylenebutenolidase
MTAHPTATAAPPVRPPIILTPDITLQSPLSRRGHGPGLVLVVDHYAALDESATNLDPPPLQKWAEEGFAVAQIKVPGRVGEGGEFPLERALEALKGLEGFDGGDVGLVCRFLECSIPMTDTLPFPFGASCASWSCL